jgi:CelD/BcsL family acetyltransferase involved in cellulose biosynthesis
MLRVVERDSLESIGREAWNALADLCSDASVFQRWEWVHPWWTALGEAHSRLRLFAAFDGDTLVGIAPLHQSRKSNGVQFLGEGHADYQCFLARDDSTSVVATLLDAVQNALPSGAQLELNEIPQFSALDLVLRARAFEAPSNAVITAATPCPRLHLEGPSSRLQECLRKPSLRRHAARLAKLGNLQVVHTADPDEVRRHLPGFFAQHIARWERTPFASLFLKQENKHFYELAAQALGAAELLVFTILSVDGRAAAYHFGLRSGHDLVWYKPAFDIALAQYSPGEVLLKNLLEFAAANGFVVFDFTRGDEPFKQRFASATHYNASYVLSRQSWRGNIHRLRTTTRNAARRVRNSLLPGAARGRQ